MKRIIIVFFAMVFIAFISTNIFAANGSKGDWGFDARYYKYALIEGEVTSIDYERGILRVKGNGKELLFDDITEFVSGDISLPMEKVFHGVEFTKDQRITSANVNVGDVIKSRYSILDSGKILLDTCLVDVNKKSHDNVAINRNTMVAEEEQ